MTWFYKHFFATPLHQSILYGRTGKEKEVRSFARKSSFRRLTTDTRHLTRSSTPGPGPGPWRRLTGRTLLCTVGPLFVSPTTEVRKRSVGPGPNDSVDVLP